jgi:adenine-specific DNA glycosylase
MMDCAIKVCEQHYGDYRKPGCSKCPISSACSSGTGQLTWESLSAWQMRCERAAAEIARAADAGGKGSAG